MVRTILGLLLVATIALPAWWLARHLHGREALEPAPARYSEDAPGACAAGSRPGNARDERTSGGISYAVKTPANYDPTRAHPLIVVYAPRFVSRTLSERFVGLTRDATASGFLVAYADSRTLSLAVIDDLGTLPERIALRWCVDERRIFFTGHSDGGTVSTALAVLGKARRPPAAIAPSAAGFRREDLEAYACPRPLSVMVLHNRHDGLFPAYGAGAASWWARCNGCEVERPQKRADGCVSYPDCASGVTTLYCESEGSHLDWPTRNRALLDFFLSTRP